MEYRRIGVVLEWMLMITPLAATLLLIPACSVQDPIQEPEQIADYPGSPFEDREGRLWFTAVGEGVVVYDGERFRTFTVADGLPGNTIRAIVEAEDGKLWVGTTRGLALFDGETFMAFDRYNDAALANASPGFSGSGFHRDLWDVHLDPQGNPWIATMDGVFHLKDGVFERFPIPALANSDKFEFTSRMVYEIYEDSDGSLWFGTDGDGVVHYQDGEQKVYTTEDGLAGNHVCALLRDARGDLWLGTSGGGVSRMHDGKFSTHLRYDEYQDHGVGWGRFLAIYEDRHDQVWFGVSGPGGGVYRWDGKAFRYFQEEDGLGSGGVFSIKEDRKGRLWLGTSSGSFFMEGERFVNFTRDGDRAQEAPDPEH